MASLLAVTRALAAPFELHAMLAAVAEAACQVLQAERASVWLYDEARAELFIEVATDLPQIRLPVGAGLAGVCAQTRRAINVPDCYADSRFNGEVDRRSGFHTRCALTLPLADHRGDLVGVMQVLNKHGGVFDADDEVLAEALAAQCAVALSRVRMTQALVAGELMRQEMELAAMLQRCTLPTAMPQVPGYAMHGRFLPASLTGGDTYDLALIEQGLLVVLADATGHGLAPALSVTQMHAMLRMAFRLGADLETAFRAVNDQLVTLLPDGHFVTSFIGLLDAHAHRLRFLSGGQGPILHFQAEHGACTAYRATSFPMGAMPVQTLRPAVDLVMAPGDWLVLLSDGVYEYADAAGLLFGRERVEQVVRQHARLTPVELADRLMAALQSHAQGVAQDDDITLVLLRRDVMD
ncbi:MAG: SpoIIE family protein phosphatase [Burkholderiales bacterium]|nr:SpoIIE family protein phosphatase [Burkholderiales bacterium]